ncbi:hypothetical protein CW700_03325 [Candidatus Bathyarchaeota archaeon]|nr:MAG: hypothetical protein CW700_03325 [Candidatus Bathyarchaeota archaeon]
MVKALIIAAGRGNRLRPYTDERPKSLVPLLGLRLIERVILSAKEAGIREFVVVTGYRGEEVRAFLGDGGRYGVAIEYVENRLWRRGNGTSVYEARGLLNGRFILLMSDHIFNPEILSELKRCEPGERECILCVDTCMEDVVDLDEATKVRVVGDRIVDIGKDLRDFNGVDTGIFLCTPYLFEVLERNIQAGRCSLTESMRDLAGEGGLRALPIDDGDYWLDVDTPESLRAAEKLLLFKASKHALATRALYRYLNTPLTRLFALTPITPNQVTLLSLLAAVASSLLFIYHHPLPAGLLALLSSVLDGVDGKLARIKHMKTTYGGIFDSFVDLYEDLAVFFGMAYYGYVETLDPLLWFLAFLALTGTIAVSVPAGISTPTRRYWVSLSKLYRCFPFKSRRGEVDRWVVECSPASKDMRYLWIFVGSTLGQVVATLWAVAVVTNLMAVYRLLRAKLTTEHLSMAEIEEYLEKIYAK